MSAMGLVARNMLEHLGVPDPVQFCKAERYYDELYGERFLGQVIFMGVHRGALHLKARDGAWKRRVLLLQQEMMSDLSALLPDKEIRRVEVRTGPLPERPS